MKIGNHDKLSEQEALECISKYRDFGCNGGWGPEVFMWASGSGGVTTADRRPYKAVDNTPCEIKLNPRSRGSKTVAGYVYIVNELEEAMKHAIVNTGPIHVSLHVSNDLAYYKSGVFNDPRNQCANQGNNHAALLVGYGNENGQDYWLVKNSWGRWWGESGYFKITRGRKLCGIARDPHWPMLA
jgi:cathepsin L